MEKRLMRIPEVVESTGLSRSEIYRAIERGELITVKFGRAVRIVPADLDSFVAAKRAESQAAPVPA